MESRGKRIPPPHVGAKKWSPGLPGNPFPAGGSCTLSLCPPRASLSLLHTLLLFQHLLDSCLSDSPSGILSSTFLSSSASLQVKPLPLRNVFHSEVTQTQTLPLHQLNTKPASQGVTPKPKLTALTLPRLLTSGDSSVASHMSLSGTRALFWCPTVEEGRPLGGEQGWRRKTRSLGSQGGRKGKEGMNMCVRKRVSGICLGVRNRRVLKSGKGRIMSSSDLT